MKESFTKSALNAKSATRHCIKAIDFFSALEHRSRNCMEKIAKAIKERKSASDVHFDLPFF